MSDAEKLFFLKSEKYQVQQTKFFIYKYIVPILYSAIKPYRYKLI